MTPDFTQLNSLFETMQDEANQLYSVMTGVAVLLILGSLIAVSYTHLTLPTIYSV